MDFFNGGLGEYLVQSAFASVVIIAVAEAMIRLWRVRDPYLQIKLRLLVLLLPVLYLPLLFLVYPQRTGAHFRQQVALIDINAWLELRLGPVSLWYLFAALLAATTAYFLVREAAPSLGHYLGRRSTPPTIARGQFPKLDSVLDKLGRTAGLPAPPVLYLSPSDAPVVHTLGRRALVLSAATIDLLDSEELEVVMAHELAHLTRRAYGVGQIALALRFLMFYNPAALLAFRRVINDNEKHCDDIAVAATGKQLALASGLIKVFRRTAAAPAVVGGGGRMPARLTALEQRAHRELTDDRVDRLVHADRASDISYAGFRVAVTAALLMVLLFFVV